ncbi:MAG: hypothetical protein QGG25_05045 [Phycisphaerae bacterium]|jgi:hypothetical protein|nr:hypothetical protein [Phycisphaerae bacterium]
MVVTDQQTPAPMSKEKRRKLLLGILAALALMFGAIMLLMGYQKSGVRAATAGEPTPITLAKLVADGPGENLYIELSDFQFGEKYVVEEGAGKVWTRAWAYLFTRGDKRNPVAVVDLSGGGEKGIKASMGKKSLRGLISAKRKPFGATVGRKLRGYYPHLKADLALYHLKQVSNRPGGGAVQAVLIAGYILLALGALLVVMTVRSK